jgi:4'-phosphopantetheinyl transferase
VDLDAGPAPDVGLLPTVDREKVGRFKFERDRRRFATARLVLRGLLADEKMASFAEPFAHSANGKPRLHGRIDCEFNLSHSEHWALIGLADRHAVGVDIEIVRPISDLFELASRHFTESEKAELAACCPEGVVRRFLQGWTRKEACLKAVGTGLTVEATAVEAGLSPSENVVSIAADDWQADVRVVSIDLGPHLIGAVARVEAIRQNPA